MADGLLALFRSLEGSSLQSESCNQKPGAALAPQLTEQIQGG